MGSGESRFNVSLIVRDKVTGQRPQTTTFEGKREPKRIRTEVLLLTSPTRLTARLSRLAGHYICHTGGRLHRSLVQLLLIMTMDDSYWAPTKLLLKCCFTSTETVGLLGTGAQDGHLDLHTAPELLDAQSVHYIFFYYIYI